MNSCTTVLSERERELLLRAMNQSLDLHKRKEFCLWVQQGLQGFLPHSWMFSAIADSDVPGLRFERFAQDPLAADRYAEIVAPEYGLLARLIASWSDWGARPVLACPVLNGFGYQRFKADLIRFGLPNVASHGVMDTTGQAASYFAFVGIPGPLTPRHEYLLRMLVPYLHSALTRVHASELRDACGARSGVKRLSGREVEILRLVRDGKSNAQIAVSIGLSPLTVKNHVQNILKKLDAGNRAQAVAFAISQRLIPQLGNRLGGPVGEVS